MTDHKPCDICGKQAVSNARITSRRLKDYEDGPPAASVPSLVVCTDCGVEVSEYFRARSGTAMDDPSTWTPGDGPPDEVSPFSEDDANALVEMVKGNDALLLDLGTSHVHGIRYVDGDWKIAEMPLPGGPHVKEIHQSHVMELVLDARRVTLKRVDSAAWEDYER